MNKTFLEAFIKKSVVIILFLSLFLSSYAMQALEDNEMNKLTYSFSFDKPIILKNQDTVSIMLSDLPQTQDTGKPIIPVKPLKILLPYGKEFDSISIKTSEKEVLEKDCTIEKGPALYKIKTEKNQDLIELSENMDSKKSIQLYSIGSLQSFRGFSLLYVNLYPVNFDPVDRSLYYYRQIDLSIKVTDEQTKSLPVHFKDIEMVAKKIDNIDILETYYPHLESTCNEIDYLIITNEYFANAEVDNSFADLKDYRIQQGYSSKITTVEEIKQNKDFFVNGIWGDNNSNNPYYTTGVLSNLSRFNDTAAKIRNYIRYMHSTYGISYVLLAGDADTNNPSENIVPVRGLFANESGLPLIGTNEILAEEEADLPSDVYYACLDGTYNDDMDEHFGESPDRNARTGTEEADLEAEVFVGRAAVDSIQEMKNFVYKTISYSERTQAEYYSQILFLGEYLGFPGISAYGGNYKDEVKPLVSEACNIRTLYDRNRSSHWTKQDLIEILEEDTPHLINHDGHAYYGYNLRMVNGDVDDLENDLPFFVYSHGCMAGGFDNPDGYDCIAEHFTVETPNAAFAVIMNSRYGLGSENSLDSPSGALDISFFKALFEEKIYDLGRANHFSKEDNTWQINENGLRWVYYQTNLFGDPLLTLHLPKEDPPDVNLSLSIEHPVDGSVYYNNEAILSLPFLKQPVMIGNSSITAEASSDPEGYVFGVEFFLNDISIHYDSMPPYECQLPSDLKGKQDLVVQVYGPQEKMISINQNIFTWIP